MEDETWTDWFKKVRDGGEEVRLVGRHIGDEGAKEVARALTDPKTKCKTLHLMYNFITMEGAKAIAKALKSNSTLMRLGLEDNNLLDEGAKAIASALEHNSTLTILRLGDNNIGNNGAKAIASALQANSTLTELDLYNNEIGHEGATAIASALQSNPTLTFLDLGDNKIIDATMTKIRTLLTPKQEKRANEITKEQRRERKSSQRRQRLYIASKARRRRIGAGQTEQQKMEDESRLKGVGWQLRRWRISDVRKKSSNVQPKLPDGSPKNEKQRTTSNEKQLHRVENQRSKDQKRSGYTTSVLQEDRTEAQQLKSASESGNATLNAREETKNDSEGKIMGSSNNSGNLGPQKGQCRTEGGTLNTTFGSSDDALEAESKLKLEKFLYTRSMVAGTGQERDVGILSHPRVLDPEWAWKPEAEMPYVFLSHRGPDTKTDIAIPTHWFLVNKLKVKCFVDTKLEPSDDQIRGLLVPAYSCTHALVLLSPNFRNSKYCVMELNTFAKRQYNNSAQVIPALWGVDDLDGYAPAVKKTVWLTNKTKTEDPAEYMIQTLWPYLAGKLDHGQGSFTSQDFAKFLSDYVQSNLVESEIPREVAERLSSHRYTKYDSRLQYIFTSVCENNRDHQEKLAILSIPDYREFYVELYLEFLSLIKAHEALVGPISEASFGNNTLVNVLFGKGLDHVKGTYVGEVVAFCESLLEESNYQERDFKWRFASCLIHSSATEFHRHEAASRVIDYVSSFANDGMNSLEDFADQFARLVVRYYHFRASHGDRSRSNAIRDFGAHCRCTSDFMRLSENPTVKDEAIVVASAAISCIMNPFRGPGVEDVVGAPADFSPPIALLATCTQMSYDSARALDRISEHDGDDKEVDLIDPVQSTKVSNEKLPKECMVACETTVSSQLSSLSDKESLEARLEQMAKEMQQFQAKLEKKGSGTNATEESNESYVEVDVGNGQVLAKVRRTPEEVYEYRLEGLEFTMKEVLARLDLLTLSHGSTTDDVVDVAGRISDLEGQLDALRKAKRKGLFSGGKLKKKLDP